MDVRETRQSRARVFGSTNDDVVIDKDWTTNDGRDATRRFYRGFASHRGGDDDDDGGFDERDERGP